jgi:HSP20 family protein
MKTNTGLSLLREFDRAFDDWVFPNGAHGLRAEQEIVPACEVEEANDHFLLTIEMPGIKKDDIKLEVHEGQLTVAGERRMENKQTQDRAWYSERRFGKFQRTFALPRGVDFDKVEAAYQDGILHIVVPKAESLKPRQIKIGTGADFSNKQLRAPSEKSVAS